MITRRQFLVGAAGAAAGLILPDWLVRAERFIEGEGAPLLELPDRYHDTLTAISWFGDEYQLFLGDPHEEPPRMNWVEFAERYFHEDNITAFLADFFGDDGELPDPEDEVDECLVSEHWVMNDSPSARAFEYLECLDLGPDFDGSDGIGEIELIEGPAPGNDSRIANAVDALSLSLLQKRLNDLGEDVRIVVG
jgi:hypothetical protein